MTLASSEFDHPGLTPLVIDLIPAQTRAEIEASIDAPLTVERGQSAWESEDGSVNPLEAA